MGGLEDDILFNWFEIEYFDAYLARGRPAVFRRGAGRHGSSRSTVSAMLASKHSTSPIRSPRCTSPETVQPTADGYRLDFEVKFLKSIITWRRNQTQRGVPSSSTGQPFQLEIGGERRRLHHHQPRRFHKRCAASGKSPLRPSTASRWSMSRTCTTSSTAGYSHRMPSDPSWNMPMTTGFHRLPPTCCWWGTDISIIRNIYGWNETNFIPPYMDDVDPWIGETATDNRYASVSGGDILPDMYIGRFPVRTPAEAQMMVDKTINYEQNPRKTVGIVN